jgi:hypothetical protein
LTAFPDGWCSCNEKVFREGLKDWSLD